MSMELNENGSIQSRCITTKEKCRRIECIDYRESVSGFGNLWVGKKEPQFRGLYIHITLLLFILFYEYGICVDK